MKKSLKTSRFHLGVCYYPEQWPESLWEDDFRRMREMGLDTIRVGEFAWSIFEPEAGQFFFEFFDRVLDLAHRFELRVILGTPTATPPAWLTERYPEVLNASQSGVPYHHGERRHTNYNAPIYQQLCARIAGAMAAHYHAHPALIGWQIDNEFNCGVSSFYSDADHVAFRGWLQAKYGTLEALNDAWGTVFWNQTYSRWEQVHLSRPTPTGSPNPHLALDEKRFISDSAIAFAKVQVEAIRVHDPAHFITTNGIFAHLDYHALTAQCLDFLSYDSYPNFASWGQSEERRPLADRKWSASLSLLRDISPQFCVMEQQSGPGGWVNALEQRSPRPGQMRLWTYQSIAHGADMVLYFRWRTATKGTEIYWHGINDYHNQPNRRCAEVAQIAGELARLQILHGTHVKAEVALLKDYDNEWDGELDVWHGPYEKQSFAAWYKTLQHRHVPSDVMYLRPDISLEALARYRCLIYPHPAILTDSTAALLEAYVHQGGTIVFACRSGYKNEYGHCPMRPLPGAIAALCGVTVSDFTRISPLETVPGLVWEGETPTASLKSGAFNDILQVHGPDARVLATYDTDAEYYAGTPALVENPCGEGKSYYYGGVFTDAVADKLADHIGLKSPTEHLLSLPLDIELVVREANNGDTFFLLLNYSRTAQTIVLHQTMCSLLDAKTFSGPREIEAYGVMVLMRAFVRPSK